MLECLYVTASFCGLDTKPEDFFKGEQEIDDLFNDNEAVETEEKDPIANEGKWVEINGQKEWIYNFDAIMDIKKHIDKLK